MNKRFVSILAIAAIVLGIANSLMWVRQSAGAARLSASNVPRVISYQGRLTDAAGNPLTGDYAMRFCLYAEPAGGAPLWCEETTVHVNYGVFSVLLGSITPIPEALFDGSDRYLGVTVEGDEEMTPRRRIASVGYAYSAVDADTLDGMHATDFAIADHSHHVLSAADGDPRDALFVDNLGRVGLGTTNPSEQLHVTGNARIDGFISSVGDVRILPGGNEKLRITTSGNVGIGTSAPSEKLTVAGTIESTSGGFKFPDGSVQTTAASKASMRMGTVGNGGTIPLPSGYSEAQCAWIASFGYANAYWGGHAWEDLPMVTLNGRSVRCEIGRGTPEGWEKFADCTANYLIICSK